MGNTLEGLEIAKNLRSGGINVDIEMNNKKVKKALNYANVENIPYVIIIGEDELKKRKVILKDMKTGEQKEVEIEKIIERIGELYD